MTPTLTATWSPLTTPTMYDNPVKLQDTCISYICDNVEAVCEVLEDPADPLAKVCTFKRKLSVLM